MNLLAIYVNEAESYAQQLDFFKISKLQCQVLIDGVTCYKVRMLFRIDACQKRI